MSRRPDADGPRFTLVAFHAHPDDEALLTGGTLAKAAADGHRVVIVTATAGEAGLATAADSADLGSRRLRELEASAAALGAARTVTLGYADSGLHGDRPNGFARADVEEAAHRLAGILVEEAADVVTIYDANGGYGHPDHVQVHRVGVRAAELAGTRSVLEATVDARLFRSALAVARRLSTALRSSAPLGLDDVFTAHRNLTHRIDVRAQLPQKRRALAAHVSQQRADDQPRSLRLLLRLPEPVFALAMGREWFVERGRPAGRLSTDIFASTYAAARAGADRPDRPDPGLHG